MGLLADLLEVLKEALSGEDAGLKPRPQTEDDKALMYTTRTETDGNLQVFEGKLPTDMKGCFYTMYPVGSVNSGGLPFPETIDGQYNPEYGTPIMNGDGFVVSINFDGTQTPGIKSRLVKPPCYFADLNTRPAVMKNGPKFNNLGLSRMSWLLGTRNLLNTALVPVKFGNGNSFLLSTYDVGRPFVMNPKKLKLETPLGAGTDWTPATPSWLPWPFPLIQTTAHPSFDARTEELFSVNYCKSATANEYYVAQRTSYWLEKDPKTFEQKLSEFCESMNDETDLDKVSSALMEFFRNLDHNLGGTAPAPEVSASSADTSVWLMRWKGQELIEKWIMVDAEGGNAIQITECMHQTSLTQDYIVLTQTAFKFSLELLINNPFPGHPGIDKFLRKLFAKAMLPYTDCYIVKRADLVAGGGKVVAHKITAPGGTYAIPVETIHYSCDYANPGGKITLYAVHNSSSCVAEWIRPYDTAKISGQPVDNNLIGMFSLGSMDINRFGKWVIDTNSMTIDNANSKQYSSPGTISAADIKSTDIRNTDDIGPNTWTIGLYAYRDMISPLKMVDTIRYIWFIANGADPDYLTEFIYDLYQNVPDRILPVQDVLNYTEKGIPQTLVTMNCATMQPIDHFQFPYGTYVRSVEFIPKTTQTPGLEYERDGYLLCTMQVPVDPVNYRSEYWLFEAVTISKGPVCKLTFDGIQFCFTLHTAWLDAASDYNLGYNVDVRTDYNAAIGKIFTDPKLKADMINFFEKNVYTDWYKQKMQ